MRVRPLRVEQAPLYLHITYSLCIHAAALAFLVALPVVGVSGTPPGGAYVVSLADKVKQPAKGGALKKTNVQPAVAVVNTAGDRPEPVPIPPNIAGPSARAPQLTATVKPLLAQVHSEPLQIRNAGGASKTDALHQAEREPAARSGTSEAVKPIQSAAPPVKEKPPVRPDVPDVLPDAELESFAAMPQRETTAPDPDMKIASSENMVRTQGKSDASSSPDANGISPEARGKDPVSQSHQAEKPSGTSLAEKDGRAGNGDSDTGSLTSGGTSSKKGGSGVRGNTGVFGEQTLALREDPSDKDMPDKGKKGTKETPPPVAIRVPEALLVREIKIEVVGDKKALSDISMGLTIKAHPANRRKHVRDSERKIEEAEIKISNEDSSASSIKTLSLRKAEKGVYIFSLTNGGKATSVAVVFHLSAWSDQGRMKEHKSFPLPLSAVAKFMFLMPEALFWDDADRFSGIIEDSHSVTKFRYETGLIWKEEKE